MLHASPCPDGSDGTAAWDIFPAEDAPAIREFLRETLAVRHSEDPIHTQRFYLDSELRQRLYEEKKVTSWRIYQKPGDAVFIPAGCAHQVRPFELHWTYLTVLAIRFAI